MANLFLLFCILLSSWSACYAADTASGPYTQKEIEVKDFGASKYKWGLYIPDVKNYESVAALDGLLKNGFEVKLGTKDSIKCTVGLSGAVNFNGSSPLDYGEVMKITCVYKDVEFGPTRVGCYTRNGTTETNTLAFTLKNIESGKFQLIGSACTEKGKKL